MEPPLWHENAGRKPWENGRNERNNPHGAISDRQLGDAAHRLVVNSLQVKTDRNGYYHQVYEPNPYGSLPPVSSFQPYNQDPTVMMQPRLGYLPPWPSPEHNNYDLNYYQPYVSSSNPYNRLNPQMGRAGFSRSGGGYVQPGMCQNMDVYAPEHVIQRPQVAAIGGHYYQQHGGGYGSSGSYPYNVATNYHHQTAGWAPASGGRGHIPQHGLQNQFSALNMGVPYQPYRH